MRHILYLLLPFFISSSLLAQSSGSTDIFVGSYSTMINTDKVTLVIEYLSGDAYSGFMNDGYQSSPVTLERVGNTFKGVLSEPSQGVEIDVYGEIANEHLIFNFIIDPLGDSDPLEIKFTRDGAGSIDNSGNEFQAPGTLVFPVGAFHPQEVIGTWTKEELYNSGVGDNYMGAGFTQTMTFLPDGQLVEGGSSARVSGSDFSGQSSGQGTGVIPGVGWYTIDNKLFIQVTQQGQTQNMQLGTYYVEGNNMLITGTSGEKILLGRKD